MPRPSSAARALLFLAPFAGLAAGCRAAAPDEPALEARAHLPTSYEAEIAHGAVRLAELAKLEAGPELLEPHPDDVLVDLNARLVALPADVAARALGWAPVERAAFLVERAAASARLDELLARGEASEISAPRLSLVAGHGGYLSVSDQVAYLERFEIVSSGPASMADPAVGVAEHGFLLQAVAQRPDAGGLVPLALELVVASLEQPIRTRTVELPGTRTEVSLQAPLSTSQRLATDVVLGPDDLLVLGGLPAGEPGQFLFLFATCDALAPGE